MGLEEWTDAGEGGHEQSKASGHDTQDNQSTAKTKE